MQHFKYETFSLEIWTDKSSKLIWKLRYNIVNKLLPKARDFLPFRFSSLMKIPHGKEKKKINSGLEEEERQLCKMLFMLIHLRGFMW